MEIAKLTMNTILRFIEILRLIPKEPDSISTPDLFKKLNASNYEISYRTVQRDLEKLSSSGLFPLTSSEGTNPLEWFWPKNAPRFQLPTMTIDEALVFKLVEDYLNPLLPVSMSDQLGHYFAVAEATLNASPMADWTNKVRIIPNTLALLPAEIDDEVLQVVYNAVLKNKQITGEYQFTSQNSVECRIHPLGLVFKGNVIYLVAILDGADKNIKQLALHRLRGTDILDDDAWQPDDFRLDDYIREGGFDYPQSDNKKIQLKIKVEDALQQQLADTPLSFDQRITQCDTGEHIVEASVQDTLHIRWWLHSFATSIEVMAPESLRNEFASKAKLLNQIYHS